MYKDLHLDFHNRTLTEMNKNNRNNTNICVMTVNHYNSATRITKEIRSALLRETIVLLSINCIVVIRWCTDHEKHLGFRKVHYAHC